MQRTPGGRAQRVPRRMHGHRSRLARDRPIYADQVGSSRLGWPSSFEARELRSLAPQDDGEKVELMIPHKFISIGRIAKRYQAPGGVTTVVEGRLFAMPRRGFG